MHNKDGYILIIFAVEVSQYTFSQAFKISEGNLTPVPLSINKISLEHKHPLYAQA